MLPFQHGLFILYLAFFSYNGQKALAALSIKYNASFTGVCTQQDPEMFRPGDLTALTKIPSPWTRRLEFYYTKLFSGLSKGVFW